MKTSEAERLLGKPKTANESFRLSPGYRDLFSQIAKYLQSDKTKLLEDWIMWEAENLPPEPFQGTPGHLAQQLVSAQKSLKDLRNAQSVLHASTPQPRYFGKLK